jgi:hypothetical protein
MWTRTAGSCIAIDLWALGCVLVYVEMKNRMWIAAWWFCILPVSDMSVWVMGYKANLMQLMLLAATKIVVEVQVHSSRVVGMQWRGEAW